MISSMIAGPSGSLWSSWRRPGYVRRSTFGSVPRISDARAGRARRRGRGGRGSAASVPAYSRRTRACSASASAPKRAVLALRRQRVGGRHVRRHGRVARQRRAVDAVRDGQRRRRPATGRAPATSSSRGASNRDPARRGPRGRNRAVGQEVAEDDETAHRVSVQDDGTGPGRSPDGRQPLRRGRRGAAPSDRRGRAVRPIRRCRDGRTRGRRARPRPSGRRRARSDPSARRGRGRAGPTPTARPAAASARPSRRTRRSVPSATEAWLTIDGMRAAYATVELRHRAPLPCRHGCGWTGGSRSAIACSCGATSSTTRTSGSCSGGDDVLLIDTRSTHVQAREIVGHLRELTTTPVTIVVDTHGHFDHAFGNHVFRPATIWGHVRLRPVHASGPAMSAGPGSPRRCRRSPPTWPRS